MKHSGKAMMAAFKLIVISLIAVIVLLAALYLGAWVGAFILEHYRVIFGVFLALLVVFALFTLYFFRDPDAMTPTGANLVVSPAHGKVDVIDTVTEKDFMGGECKRISIFLSIIDIHVQNAPLTGRVAFFKHTPGQYLSATRSDCAQCNENVFVGIDSFEPREEKIALRLIAGLIARRIVPWISENDPIQRGDRIGLIQFGSRVEIYLPMRAKLKISLGQRVVGGETVIASFD